MAQTRTGFVEPLAHRANSTRLRAEPHSPGDLGFWVEMSSVKSNQNVRHNTPPAQLGGGTNGEIRHVWKNIKPLINNIV